MIDVPIPNSRDSIIYNLNQLLDAYFRAGKSAQKIASSTIKLSPSQSYAFNS